MADDRNRSKRSVVVAARQHLSATLKSVRDQLTRVINSEFEDPEAIHKFRVATRRALAAVQAFDAYLPKPAIRRAKRRLRSMRRSAGEARDWDVFYAGVSEWNAHCSDIERPGMNALIGWAAAKRDSARTGLTTLAEGHPKRVHRLILKTVNAIRPPKDGKATQYQDLALEQWTTQFGALTEEFSNDAEDDAQLHRVRVMGKKLRYTGELFADVRSPEERERLDPMLTELQDILGGFNDGSVAVRHLDSFANHFQRFHPSEWELVRAGVESVTAYHSSNRDAARQRFHEWKTRWWILVGSTTTQAESRRKSVNNPSSSGVCQK